MTARISTGKSADPAFARVGDAFAAVLAGQPALGAALCVVVEGRTVVDVWGGLADLARTRPWASDSVVNVYSTTRALIAVAADRLAERGALDLDAPVARLWPEFASAGSRRSPPGGCSTLRGAAGRPGAAAGGTLYNWDAMTGALTAEAPWWQPGTAHGDHRSRSASSSGNPPPRLRDPGP